jgi:hypothetical protein
MVMSKKKQMVVGALIHANARQRIARGILADG